MKCRITLSIALALSIVLVSLTASDSFVQAQVGELRGAYDTGIVALGPNQVLRIGVVSYRETDFNVRFRRLEYMQTACNGGVCKLAVASQSTTDPITLMPNEALGFNTKGDPVAGYVRGVVLSSSRDARVTATIVNTLTGETVSHIIMANTKGDF